MASTRSAPTSRGMSAPGRSAQEVSSSRISGVSPRDRGTSSNPWPSLVAEWLAWSEAFKDPWFALGFRLAECGHALSLDRKADVIQHRSLSHARISRPAPQAPLQLPTGEVPCRKPLVEVFLRHLIDFVLNSSKAQESQVKTIHIIFRLFVVHRHEDSPLVHRRPRLT